MARSTTTTETARRANRSNAEWDAIALNEIVPALQAGTLMKDIRAQYGAGVTIRKALSRVGYDTRGQQVSIGKTAGSNGKVLAKRVAERRTAQPAAAWWRLEMETGKSTDELKALLTQHGYESVVNGRVIVSERGKRKLAKAEAEAAAAAAKPARKRTRKPKVSA